MINEKFLFETLKSYNVDICEEDIITNHLETVNHVIRCAKLAEIFGGYLNFSKEDNAKLVSCALLHDIGKFYTNPKVLYKEGRLTNSEFDYIKKHTEYDFILNDADVSIKHCIKYHHDNCQQTGYHKTDISTKHDFVKIISLIDCFDAMSNKRCYKDFAYTIDEVIKEIELNIEKQFDCFYGHKFITFLNEVTDVDYVS